MTPSTNNSLEPRYVEASGPRPFFTRYVFHYSDGSLIDRHSRHHRKRLARQTSEQAGTVINTLILCLWMPRKLNWWIGGLFATGSLLFVTAALMSLFPFLIRSSSFETRLVNLVYFAGSIPFTAAAYLQLFQSANAAPLEAPEKMSVSQLKYLGWKPNDAGWLSCSFQFLGTILFNINTFDAMTPSLTPLREDIVVWVPNIVGSILFLASGYLAFIETCHAYWRWNIRSLSWWIVLVNLIGCSAFIVSAFFSISLPGTPTAVMTTTAVASTLFGAVCFLISSLLLLPETAYELENVSREAATT